MANDEASKKESLRTKVKDRVKPPPGKASELRARALDSLAALLDSDDEAIRLQAAQAILLYAKEPEKKRTAAKLIKKLPGVS